jgi:DNA repair photolyase
MIEFDLIYDRKLCYQIEGFKPVFIDAEFLYKQGIDYNISAGINRELAEGSQWYQMMFSNRTLNPVKGYVCALTDANEELEIHNYTGRCPTNVLEVSPSGGSCVAGCQYCLVTDGKHIKDIVLYTNYAEKLDNSLKRNKDKRIFYYFSPKTEAFSETHLYNGVVHDILRTFINHYETYPDSSVRIFIATKAGMKHLSVEHKGASVFDLLKELSSKVQINGSIGIMPPYIRNILEPNVASIEERLELLQACRESGIVAESVLCQPLLVPYLTEDVISDYINRLSQAGVKNIKPEFFTSEIKNLVLVAQYINHYDPDKLAEFFYPYLHEGNQDHIKQRKRLAPERKICVGKLSLINRIARSQEITISLCNWVKWELSKENVAVNHIDKDSSANGYRCLGYQTKLFG